MSYCPQIDGLPGGDGHAGWLVSASRQILNLWECSPGGGGGPGGLPSVMVLHTQMTDFLSTCLAVEPALQLMFGASADTRGTAQLGYSSECVSVHSMNPEAGMLATKYRMMVPDPSAPRPGQVPAVPAGQQRKISLPKVVSLHPLGRMLRGCVGAAFGPRLLVYETHLSVSGVSNINKARLDWKAHEAPVTALHAAAITGQLYSGAADGSVAVWNMRERLGTLVRKMSHGTPQPITSIQLVNDQMLATSGADTKVLLWDLRSPSTPMQTVIPDGTPVHHMKMSPAGDCLAVVTARGLYSVDLLDGGGALTLIAEVPPNTRAPLDIEWNWNTGELYTSGFSGSINVFRRKA